MRAASLRWLERREDGQSAMLADTLHGLAIAVLLVGAGERIMFANRPAVALLAEGRVLRDVAGRLVATDAEGNKALRVVLLAATCGDTARSARPVAALPAPASRRRWLVHATPLPSIAQSREAVAAVFVREAALDTTQPLEIVAKLYDLTATELRVLQGIVEIGGVPAVAEAFGVAPTTVKTHLRSVFAKTGMRRQVDLVRLLAAHASPFAI